MPHEDSRRNEKNKGMIEEMMILGGAHAFAFISCQMRQARVSSRLAKGNGANTVEGQRMLDAHDC